MIRCKIDHDLELRPLETAHAGDLFALVEENREYLREWLPWVDGNATVEDSKEFISSSDGQLACGMWHRGELVGVIGYQKAAWSESTARIGYWLGAAFQGQGIVTRSCRALIDHAFTELGMERAEILCAVGNRKSRAIPQRLGFVEEATIQDGEWLYDHFVDLVVYGMSAGDWRHAGEQSK